MCPNIFRFMLPSSLLFDYCNRRNLAHLAEKIKNKLKLSYSPIKRVIFSLIFPVLFYYPKMRSCMSLLVGWRSGVFALKLKYFQTINRNMARFTRFFILVVVRNDPIFYVNVPCSFLVCHTHFAEISTSCGYRHWMGNARNWMIKLKDILFSVLWNMKNGWLNAQRFRGRVDSEKKIE